MSKSPKIPVPNIVAYLSTAQRLVFKAGFLESLGGKIDVSLDFGVWLNLTAKDEIETEIERRPVYSLGVSLEKKPREEGWIYVELSPQHVDDFGVPSNYRTGCSPFKDVISHSSSSRIDFKLGCNLSEGCALLEETKESLDGVRTRGAAARRISKKSSESELEEKLPEVETPGEILEPLLDALDTSIVPLSSGFERGFPAPAISVVSSLLGVDKSSQGDFTGVLSFHSSFRDTFRERMSNYHLHLCEELAVTYEISLDEALRLAALEYSASFLTFSVNFKNVEGSERVQIILETDNHQNGVLNEDALLEAAMKLRNLVVEPSKWMIEKVFVKQNVNH